MDTQATPAAAPAPVYFRKEIASTQFFVKGRAVDFELLDGNRGVGRFDPAKDAELIAGMNEAAAKHRGGIVKITAQEYEDLKKNHPYSPSSSNSGRNAPLRVMPSPPKPKGFGHQAAGVAGAAETASPPPAVPATTPPPPAPESSTSPNPEPKPPPKRFQPAVRRVTRKPASPAPSADAPAASEARAPAAPPA